MSFLSNRQASKRPVARRPIRVLHVVASAQRRGSQVFLADLLPALDAEASSHRVGVLRQTGASTIDFQVPTTWLGSARRGARQPPIDPVILRRLRVVARDWRPDVIQAHGGEALKYVTFATGRSLAPIIYRRIGAAHDRVRRWHHRALYGPLMRRAALTVAVSEEVRRESIRVFRLDPRRVITIPNAVDAARLVPSRMGPDTRRALGISASSIVVLSIGALTWEKDPLGQVEIARRVLATNPEALFLMVGDGPLRRELHSAIRRLDVERSVVPLGAREDVPDLLHASDILLLASTTEGMPGTAIEAGITGVPVVGYAIGGVGEVVIQDETGLLAPPGHRDSLLAQLTTLIADGSKRTAMGQRAKEWCISQFEIGSVAPRYDDLYRMVRREL